MNLVNKAYAEAANRTAPAIRAHLVEVLRPVYGAASPQMVDQIAEHIGRGVPSSLAPTKTEKP